jgi:hypothetical protein
MRAESPARTLANMSAPPRSTVKLPRLAPNASEAEARGERSAIDNDAFLQSPRLPPPPKLPPELALAFSFRSAARFSRQCTCFGGGRVA